MRNIGNIEHNGRVMYVQLTDNGKVYLSGDPVEHYPRPIRDKVMDLLQTRQILPG